MKEFERCSLQIPEWWKFVDSVPIAREAMKAKGLKCPLRLSALYEHYNLPYVGEAHRALADVNMLASVLQMLLIDLRMSLSEFMEKSFTTRDIARFSPTGSNLMESFSQEFEAISEFSTEVEVLEEVSHAADRSYVIPWDDLDLESDMQTNMNMDINKQDKGILEIDLPKAASSSDISSDPEIFYDSDISSTYLELDDIDTNQLSPMLREYLQTKSKRPDFLLLWRTGEYYQAFFNDAKKLSELCGVPLSVIGGNEFLDILVPMTSLHRGDIDVYIQDLLKKGVCIWKEDVAGEVEGHESTILTPGIMIAKNLNGSLSNFIAAVFTSDTDDATWGLAYSDISTGEINVTEGQGQKLMLEEIFSLDPCEILCSQDILRNFDETAGTSCFPCRLPEGFTYTSRPGSEFSLTFFDKIVPEFFKPEMLHDHQVRRLPAASCAVGGLLGFIQDICCAKQHKLCFHKITSYDRQDYMVLDEYTKFSLELFKTKGSGEFKGSLLWGIDCTKTPMGKRLLRKWLCTPLMDRTMISLRQDAVEAFVKNSELRGVVRTLLSRMNDLERLALSVVTDECNPWNFLALGQSINILQTLHARLSGQLNPYLAALESYTNLFELGRKLMNTFEATASSILDDQEVFRGDVDFELNAMKEGIQLMDTSLNDLEKLEQDRTKISCLKIIQNEGEYVFNVTKDALRGIPFPAGCKTLPCDPSQDTVSFYTTSLLEFNKIRSDLMRRLKSKEMLILRGLKDEVCFSLCDLQRASQQIAAIDVLASFAEAASSREYCKPAIIEGSREIKVIGGRHPITELLKPAKELFSASSLYMGCESAIDTVPVCETGKNIVMKLTRSFPSERWPSPDVLILTGPPTSGKSSYLCQAGLIQILAQIGCYVPAEQAELGIADAILIKAEELDYQSKGKSTFDVNSGRCVEIFKQATSRSLILLDDVERCLILNDGAVLRAFVEFLAQDVKARTILVTRSKELHLLEEELHNIASFQCVKNGDSVPASYYIKPGFYIDSSISSLSRIDEFPQWIISRAAQLMRKDAIEADEPHPQKQQNGSQENINKEADQCEQQQISVEGYLEESEIYFQDTTSMMPESSRLKQNFVEAGISRGETLQQQKASASPLHGSTVMDRQDSDCILEYSYSGADSKHGFSPADISSEMVTMVPVLSWNNEDTEQDLKNAEPPLEETWQAVLRTLEEFPATHALARQKGVLVSMERSQKIMKVQMSTSALFLEKFLQQEHATALENAFLTVMQSPIQLSFTTMSEQSKT
ncbi:hypothetical protein KP509_29G036200 [Ceratopteris richardii]|nr:hypothetical protein KP509_29G036200 [Ceratopteris richardii]